MNIKEFYAKYNLNKSYFAPIAGVGTKTLAKFANGQPIREDSKARIEKAMRVAEKYNLVRPRYDHAEGLGFFGAMYNTRFLRKVQEYTKHFKHLIETEGSE